MKNKKSKRILLLLVILLAVSVGFALLSRQLNIFGLSNISASKWLIHWDNVANEDGMRPTTHAYIKDTEKKIVEFAVDFDTPGQYYEFTVDAVNEGTMDADLVEVISKVNGKDISTLPVYIVYSVTYDDGTDPTVGNVLSKKVGDTPGRQTYKVKIKYDENLLTNELYEEMPNELNYRFTFSVKYSQHGVEPGPSDFEDDSWPIIAVEGNEAAKQETTDGSCGLYNIGDTKEVDLGDLGVHTVRIANCSTPPECSTEGFSQTACGFVLEFTDIVSHHRMNQRYDDGVPGGGNNGSWKYSDMRAYVNGIKYLENTVNEIDYTGIGIIDNFPSDLKSMLKETTVVSGYGEVNAGLSNTTTQDKLYLLNPREVWGKSSGTGYSSADKDTRQLDYYSGKGVTYSEYSAVIKNDENWWLRCPALGGKYSFVEAVMTGNVGHTWADYEFGVSPAFKIGE